jgi:hypothetical protein
MKKKSQEILLEQVIFLVLVLIILIFLFYYINRAGTQSGVIEQEYSKIIALVIDSAKPGTNITLDLSEVYDKARKTHFDERELVNLNNSEKKVIVKTIRGSGYSFNYFNNVSILWNPKPDERRLYLEVRDA